ncbi:MAG: hypothetical protein IJS08_12005, partial [Victivallales bacterium]|nr:hypothetical protein [Victivallales bacterium]
IADISQAEFEVLTLKPTEQLLRLKAELAGTKADYKGLTIFDTPGYNSLIIEHEEVLREFLPESDVVVFPVNYRVGFGQEDQGIMTLIAELSAAGNEIPVLLVVNRAPKGATLENDVRIKEIKSHAEDTLHRPVTKLIIIQSSLPDAEGHSTLPHTDALWSQVKEIAFSKERQESFVRKCNELLANFFNQYKLELEGIILAARNPEAVDLLREQQARLQEDRQAGFAIVEKYTERMKRQVPRIMEHSMANLLDEVDAAINDASKWVDIQDCTTYINAHVVPFGTRKVAKEISDYISSEIELMDKELEELANRAFQRLNDQVNTVEEPQLKELLGNLTMRLAQQVGGKAANAMLGSIGGVGGSAAGLGNLVKMAVKRIGNLFGKTFGREVYNTIGKIFTKKMMAALGIGMEAVIEIVFYIKESLTWRNELKERIHEVLANWKDTALKELVEQSLPELQKNNHESVGKCFDAINSEFQNSIDAQMKAIPKEEVARMEKDIAKLTTALATLQ